MGTNIRTLNDVRETDESTHLIGSLSSDVQSGQSSKVHTILDVIFPHCTFFSVLLLITVVQWAVFIATVSIGPDANMPLAPTTDTLYKFQANYPPAIQRGQVQRLILPLFLHASFAHIVFNTFFQLRMGFGIEKRYGKLLFTVLYFVAGFSGNVFSASISFCNSLKVGASTAGYGLIGLSFAELTLAWSQIRNVERTILNIFFFVLTTSLFAAVPGGSPIDHWGHIGGIISGYFLGIIFNNGMDQRPSWYPFARNCVIGGLCIFYATTLSIIFAIDRNCTEF